LLRGKTIGKVNGGTTQDVEEGRRLGAGGGSDLGCNKRL